MYAHGLLSRSLSRIGELPVRVAFTGLPWRDLPYCGSIHSNGQPEPTVRRSTSPYTSEAISLSRYSEEVEWQVEFYPEFDPEFDALPEQVQDELLAHALLLEQFGPQLGRPRVDTLKGSKHTNMKELRFDASDGVWRVAFAFDPKRNAILLVAGDKSGGSEKRFYNQLIAKADERFDDHLERAKKKRK
jgi:hypothetical protein